MSEKFMKVIPFTMKWEGGLSDDPADTGGLTKYGVCQEFLSDCAARHPEWLKQVGISNTGSIRSMVRALSKPQAEDLFRLAFWEPYRLDELPLAVAACVFDMNVNHGGGNAVRIAQRACNKALTGDPLAVDGKMGPKTRAALALMGTDTGIESLCEARRAFYRQIVDARPSQRVFLKGWLNRADDLERFAGGLL